MARAQRTAELLAAAGLADRDLERERIAAQRDAARSQALASLLPSLLKTGAVVAGDFADADAAKAALAVKKQGIDATAASSQAASKAKELDALDRIGARKERTAADLAKSQAATAKLERETAEKTRETSMTALRANARAPGATAETLVGRAVADPALGDLDDGAVTGILDEERQKVAIDKKRAAPPAPKTGPSAESVRRQQLKDENLELTNAQLRGRPAREDEQRATVRGDKLSAVSDKKRATVVEVEGYVKNIDDNITDVERLIDEVGTFETTGPESAIMDRKLTDIATDLAKLADPGSVAREGEVALMRRSLVDTGWKGLGTSNSTAKKVLEALRSDVARRRSNAYEVRQIPLPDEVSSKPVSDGATGIEALSDDDLDAEIAALKGNR